MVKQALVVCSVPLLLSGCIYVPVPRPTYIRPGADIEADAGVAVLRSNWHGPAPVGRGSARLGLNPSNWLGFDLSIYGCWGGGPFGIQPFGASLAARVRPIPKLNTMLFGEASLGCLHAGIAQGMPVTGREVVTLALITGKWPSERVTGILNYDWYPLVLGSASWHARTNRLRITPSLVGGCYCDDNWRPGTWLLGFSVSAAGWTDDGGIRGTRSHPFGDASGYLGIFRPPNPLWIADRPRSGLRLRLR